MNNQYSQTQIEVINLVKGAKDLVKIETPKLNPRVVLSSTKFILSMYRRRVFANIYNEGIFEVITNK